MTEREIGAETASCPNCGTQLKAVDQPDGSVAYETCPSCYPEQQTAQADPRQAASQPSMARETGTYVYDSEE